MRAALLASASFVVTTAVVTNAWIQKQQFYPTVVYLTKSSPCLAVLYTQALVLVFLLGKLMRKIFFGQLRAAETESLIERSWYAITDTCLAFTMFRDDLNPLFVASFTLLLFLKCFHWLLDDRVDYMERSPVISLLFKMRVISLLSILLVCDVALVYISYLSTMSKGPSVQLVFGFEYSVLSVMLLTIFCKYFLHLIDLQSENPWENKAVYMLYVELVTGFLRVVFYCGFTAIMVKVHTFPLFCIRPMYLTARQFKKAVSDIVLSRRAIQNMNTLYPDATAEELAASDNTCIICREEMVAPDPENPQASQSQGVNKKLPCGHIFHATCLRSWFQRMQTCPTCRLDVLQESLINANQNGANNNAAQQQNQQQQQQQQQQQPNEVPPPGAVPPYAAFYAQFYPNMAPPPPMPQQPAAGDTAGAAAGEAPHTMPPRTPFSPMMMPPPPPPPPMPPFPMMPPMMSPMMMMPQPPPPPPAELSGMSDEQLRAMEGDQRKAIEARVECLSNIKVLLDAAFCNIEQYMSAAGGTNAAKRTTFTFPPSSTAAATATTASGSKTTEEAAAAAASSSSSNNNSNNQQQVPVSESDSYSVVNVKSDDEESTLGSRLISSDEDAGEVTALESAAEGTSVVPSDTDYQDVRSMKSSEFGEELKHDDVDDGESNNGGEAEEEEQLPTSPTELRRRRLAKLDAGGKNCSSSAVVDAAKQEDN